MWLFHPEFTAALNKQLRICIFIQLLTICQEMLDPLISIMIMNLKV